MTSDAWTTVARASVGMMFIGIAMRFATGWRIGDYVAAGAFLVLLATLRQP